MSELDELYKSLMSEESKTSSMSLTDIVTIVKKYWNFLWEKKWIIIISGVLCGILGFVYVCNKKITYTAHYVFTVGNSGSSNGFSLSSLLGMNGGSMDAFSGDNVLELLKSRTIVEKTLLSPCLYEGDTITFMEYSLICDSVRAKCELGEMKKKDENQVSICDVSFPVGQERETFTRAQDSILMMKSGNLLKHNIAVSRRDKKLSYMEYDFIYTDEDFAKSFSAEHLKVAADFYVQTKTHISGTNLYSFQQKADSVRRELDKTIAKSSAFLDGNRNASGSYVTAQLKKYEIDIQVLSTTYQEIQKNIKALELDLARETPLIQIIDKPVLPLSNDKTRKLKGLIVGGFLGGFLACLGCIAFLYFKDLKTKIEQESKEISSSEQKKELA